MEDEMFEYILGGSFLLGFIIGGIVVSFIITQYPQQPATIVEPTYNWKCSEPYAKEGSYWITCEKFVCFSVGGKDFCKSLGEKLELEVVR